MKILITGADGFIGTHLLKSLDTGAVDFDVVAVTRRKPSKDAERNTAIGDMCLYHRWDTLFAGVDVVVHLAAKVHQMGRQDAAEFDEHNCEVVERMIEAAAAANVSRFILLSSIKAADSSAEDAYSHSKLKAEQIAIDLGRRSRMEVVVIRPPLVYGPGVRANFQRLWKVAQWPLPLPFAAINNRRAMISVYNLCDVITLCLDCPAVGGKILSVADARSYSLPEIISVMRRVLGRRASLFPIPLYLMQNLLLLVGGLPLKSRLLDDLEVDIRESCRLLDWHPRFDLEHTLASMLECKP